MHRTQILRRPPGPTTQGADVVVEVVVAPGAVVVVAPWGAVVVVDPT